MHLNLQSCFSSLKLKRNTHFILHPTACFHLRWGMCYPVCGMVHIKEALLLSEWSYTVSDAI